jgi:hypothetical protein
MLAWEGPAEESGTLAKYLEISARPSEPFSQQRKEIPRIFYEGVVRQLSCKFACCGEPSDHFSVPFGQVIQHACTKGPFMDAIPSKEKVERSRKYWGVLAYAKQGLV